MPKTATEPKPSPRPTRKPLLSTPEAVTAKPRRATAERPMLLESAVFRADVEQRLKQVTGAIDVLDAHELQADRDHAEAIRALNERREAERGAQAHRRADLVRIESGCRAALDASEPIPAPTMNHYAGRDPNATASGSE